MNVIIVTEEKGMSSWSHFPHAIHFLLLISFCILISFGSRSPDERSEKI